jgi:hypothetical protein
VRRRLDLAALGRCGGEPVDQIDRVLADANHGYAQ